MNNQVLKNKPMTFNEWYVYTRYNNHYFINLTPQYPKHYIPFNKIGSRTVNYWINEYKTSHLFFKKMYKKLYKNYLETFN